MTIRCPECGYENRDMYRFCGMCGATLRREAPTEEAPHAPRIMPADEPQRATAVSAKAAPSASVPGFITEGSTPRSLDYLLEDDVPKSRAKLLVTLALLLVAAGLMAWHWQRDGYPWADARSPKPAASTAPENANAGSPSTAAPTPKTTQEASAPKPEPPKPAPPVTQVAESNQQTLSPPENPSSEPAPPMQEASSPAETKPEEAPADKPSTASAEPPAAAAVPPSPAPKAKPKPTPSAPTLSGDDKLVADGEKYLYGNGVAENCDLAQKNLRTAAGHSNSRALTLMGAMYATGHCVNRDLPTAYRWFAKALRQDPSNGRVQQDLEILWKQMTPEERQLATKGGG